MFMDFLINTIIGDRVCFLIERLTGYALVPLDDLDCRIVATDGGRAVAKGEKVAGRAGRCKGVDATQNAD